MRTFVFFSVFILQYSAFGQTIANCIDVLGRDSLRFYFKSHGSLVDKECADYYRVAKVDPDVFVFNGHSRDYFISGELAVASYYSDNFLHSDYKAFYHNGQIKEQGRFNHGWKTGEWNYWYENGRLKKTIIFSDNGFYLRDFYNRNGKQLVKDGNGKYDESGLTQKVQIKGEIKNGKQHGKWTIYNHVSQTNTAIERFENGKFIQGQNVALVKSFNEIYRDEPRATVDKITDLLSLSYSTKIDCYQYGAAHRYDKKTYNSNYTFLPFYDHIYQNFDAQMPTKGYILVGFTIDPSGNLMNTSSYSSSPDERLVKQLLDVFYSSEIWVPEKHNHEPVSSTELFTFQFLGNTYKILGDTRNRRPAIEYGAEFVHGNDSLRNFILSKLPLPSYFFDEGFSVSMSISFSIDAAGSWLHDASDLQVRLNISDDERRLYSALVESFQKTDKQWLPAVSNGAPVTHHFHAALTIRAGQPQLRIFSVPWILKERE